MSLLEKIIIITRFVCQMIGLIIAIVSLIKGNLNLCVISLVFTAIGLLLGIAESAYEK